MPIAVVVRGGLRVDGLEGDGVVGGWGGFGEGLVEGERVWDFFSGGETLSIREAA